MATNTNLKLVEQPDADHEEAALRSELRRLLEQRDAALVLRDKAADTSERAAQFIAGIEAGLADFASVDARVAQERATAFKVALERNAEPVLAISSELKALSARRMDLENQLAGARLARETLTQELQEAQTTLDRLQANVEQMARAVVGHTADQKARELAEYEAECATLRQRLLGATAMRPGGQFPLQSQTLALLRDEPANAIFSRNGAGDATRWNDLYAKLLHDHSARLE